MARQASTTGLQPLHWTPSRWVMTSASMPTAATQCPRRCRSHWHHPPSVARASQRWPAQGCRRSTRARSTLSSTTWSLSTWAARSAASFRVRRRQRAAPPVTASRSACSPTTAPRAGFVSRSRLARRPCPRSHHSGSLARRVQPSAAAARSQRRPRPVQTARPRRSLRRSAAPRRPQRQWPPLPAKGRLPRQALRLKLLWRWPLLRLQPLTRRLQRQRWKRQQRQIQQQRRPERRQRPPLVRTLRRPARGRARTSRASCRRP
mmetsp:Transcript_63215/g.203762  ORF Transcript_63215/g.203762 Transcript_63215/m.203762 type:complete len:262 (+) Transcript_63215:392-1177(+)